MSELGPDVDPFQLFLADRSRAETASEPWDSAACVLATVDARGRPRARFVLSREVDPDGLCVFTNYESAKGHELAAHPFGALTFHFVTVGVQWRFEGPMTRVPPERSDAYSASRPRESQIGAWASAQSRPIASRDALIEAVHEATKRFEGRPVPRPPHWGGYKLVPDVVERWVNGPHRLHDRWSFVREGDGWKVTRLSP